MLRAAAEIGQAALALSQAGHVALNDEAGFALNDEGAARASIIYVSGKLQQRPGARPFKGDVWKLNINASKPVCFSEGAAPGPLCNNSCTGRHSSTHQERWHRADCHEQLREYPRFAGPLAADLGEEV